MGKIKYIVFLIMTIFIIPIDVDAKKVATCAYSIPFEINDGFSKTNTVNVDFTITVNDDGSLEYSKPENMNYIEDEAGSHRWYYDWDKSYAKQVYDNNKVYNCPTLVSYGVYSDSDVIWVTNRTLSEVNNDSDSVNPHELQGVISIAEGYKLETNDGKKVMCSHKVKLDFEKTDLTVEFYIDKDNNKRYSVRTSTNDNYGDAAYNKPITLQMKNRNWTFYLDTENADVYYKSASECKNAPIFLDYKGGAQSQRIYFTTVEPEEEDNAAENKDGKDYEEPTTEKGSWDPESLCGKDNENCNIDITKFCTDPYVARTLKFIGLLLVLAKILIPALIIGLGFVDLAKIVISGKMDTAKKQAVNIVKRVIIGVAIFLIPTILITIYNVAYSIATDSEVVTDGNLHVPKNFKNCVGCILDATNENACVVDSSSISSNENKNSSNNKIEYVDEKKYGSLVGNGLVNGQISIRNNGVITLDKSLIVLSQNYVDYAKINATVKSGNNKKLTWSSSNPNVASVNSNGEVLAKGGGSTTITVRNNDGSAAQTKVTVISRAKYFGNGKWQIESGDYTVEEKEAYINTAEELCHSSWYQSHSSKYTFCPAETLSYYVGDRFSLSKRYMQKQLGVSATNYLVFLSSAKQTITLFQKNSQGKWKVLKSDKTSTGKTNNVNHYRHDFWLGAMYDTPGYNGIVFYQFSKYAGGHSDLGAYNIYDEWYSHRAIHYGFGLGYPNSAGCGRVSLEFRNYLATKLNNQFGTRIIYF